MESGWKWDRLDPLERQVAELLLEGNNNAAICAEVFHSRARVQDCIKKIVIKTETDSTRGAIVLLAEERESLSLLHVLEQATDGVAIVQDRVLKYANKALAEACGYDADEMVGIPLVELLAPGVRDRAVSHYELRMKGDPFPRSYVTTVLCKGGQEKELMVANAGLIRYRGRPAIMTVAFDPKKVGEEAGNPPLTGGAGSGQGTATH
jgi:PAS domain S-box-containing protein